MDEPIWLDRLVVDAVHLDQLREHGDMEAHEDILKRAAIEAAHRYSVILSVFDSVTRVPEIASGILLTSLHGPLLITAGHVLQRFRDLGANGRLQIGADRFTLQGIPTDLMRFSRDHDLVALKLEVADLTSAGKEALLFTQVRYDPVAPGELVAFVGYPGYWKKFRKEGVVGLGSYEFFGPVRTVEVDQFSLLVEPTYEIRVGTTREDFSLGATKSLGGLSGAPIFSAEVTPRLVGWISEGRAWTPTDHKIFAMHANALTGVWRV